MSYVLDTNICIALLKKADRDLIEKFKLSDPKLFFLCSIVKAELVFGARKSQKVESNLELLKFFFSQFESLPFDDKASEQYGIIRAVLEKLGTPIGTHDLLIASICLTHDFILLTRNRSEFSRVPLLRMEEW